MDDLVIKSKKEESHLNDLRKVFSRCRKYKLRMNPLKCVFGVTSGKFLGFVVDRQGVQMDQDKQRAILEMPCPRTAKELKSFLGKVSYLRRFVPGLAEITHPLMQLLRKNTKVQMGRGNSPGVPRWAEESCSYHHKSWFLHRQEHRCSYTSHPPQGPLELCWHKRSTGKNDQFTTSVESYMGQN